MNTEHSQQYRVLLYYLYTPIEEPKKYVEEHRALCKELELLGRILIGEEGINGTLAGTIEKTEEYKKRMHADQRFHGMAFKEHLSEKMPFYKLKIKYRKEIVTLGAEDIDPKNGGKHLSPKTWHEMAQEENAVILDARNNFEWEIGKFKNALLPDIDYFREFPEWVKKNKAQLKKKKVLMYCTGGIRCEKASAVLKKEGIDEVYQLDGGIINYGKEIPDGLWEGSCFVFDERRSVQVNDDAHHAVISKCHFCDQKSDRHENCCNAECNKMILLCNTCKEKSNNACSEECSKKHRNGVVKKWDIKTRQAI